jgi:hypothetical protein
MKIATKEGNLTPEKLASGRDKIHVSSPVPHRRILEYRNNLSYNSGEIKVFSVKEKK